MNERKRRERQTVDLPLPIDVGRHLSLAEQEAAKRVLRHLGPDGHTYRYGQGFLHYATGDNADYWIGQLLGLSNRFQQLADEAAMLAKIMRDRKP